MPAFINLGDIKGEATDDKHKDWIIIQSMSSPIYRSIPEGAKDAQRTKGETTLGDIVVVRELDKSSTKLQEACANGTFFKKVDVHFFFILGNSQEPYLKYELENVIVSSYSFHGNSAGDPLPSEEITLGYTKSTWTYVILDPETGKPKGDVGGSYEPGKGKAG